VVFMESEYLWQSTLKEIKRHVSEDVYEFIFGAVSSDGYEDGRLVLLAESEAVRQALLIGQKWLIEVSLREVAGRDVAYTVKIEAESLGQVFEAPTRLGVHVGVNPTITFDVVCKFGFNDDAYALARAVAENPRTRWSPLYLYSEMPLGKTALLHAVGNEIIRLNPHLHVLYCTAEEFTNDFLDALRASKGGDESAMKRFRNKYRGLDVWLLDEVNFMEKMPCRETEEEFYHTLASMDHKQMVIAGTTSPREIGFSEQRIVSRLEKGVVQRIELPGLEDRISIIEAWCMAEGIELMPAVISYMAKIVETILLSYTAVS